MRAFRAVACGMRYLLALALLVACGDSEDPTGNQPSGGSAGAAGMSTTERLDAGAADGGEPKTSRCGNGVIEPGESCDFGIPGGTVGSCPVTCDDDDPCTDDRLVGSLCQTVCLNVPQGGICNPQEPDPELPLRQDSAD